MPMGGGKATLLLAGLIVGFWAMSTLINGSAAINATVAGCPESRQAVAVRLPVLATIKWGECRSTTIDGVHTVTLSVDSNKVFGTKFRSVWLATVRGNDVESVVQLR